MQVIVKYTIPQAFIIYMYYDSTYAIFVDNNSSIFTFEVCRIFIHKIKCHLHSKTIALEGGSIFIHNATYLFYACATSPYVDKYSLKLK